jgi:hypothetical protein
LDDNSAMTDLAHNRDQPKHLHLFLLRASGYDVTLGPPLRHSPTSWVWLYLTLVAEQRQTRPEAGWRDPRPNSLPSMELALTYPAILIFPYLPTRLLFLLFTLTSTQIDVNDVDYSTPRVGSSKSDNGMICSEYENGSRYCEARLYCPLWPSSSSSVGIAFGSEALGDHADGEQSQIQSQEMLSTTAW